MGPVSISTGSTAASATACTRASGRQPCAAATSLVVTSIAAAPSEICEALPAVTVPPSSNAGRSPASTSCVVPGRIPSSCDTVTAPSLAGAAEPHGAVRAQDHRDDLVGERARTRARRRPAGGTAR